MEEKHSVALIIYNEDQSRFLMVRRPYEDGKPDYEWGFPAASKTNLDENWEEVVHRAAKTKLGVEVEIVKLIGESSSDRGNYILTLRDYEVRIVKGEPSVPQASEGVTQYVEFKFSDDMKPLIDSAQKGSVCTRIFLDDNDVEWNT